jgi:hypothetical protein
MNPEPRRDPPFCHPGPSGLSFLRGPLQGQWTKLHERRNQQRTASSANNGKRFLVAAQQSAQRSLEKALGDLRKEVSVGGVAATSSVLTGIMSKGPANGPSLPSSPSKRPPSSIGSLSPPYRRADERQHHHQQARHQKHHYHQDHHHHHHHHQEQQQQQHHHHHHHQPGGSEALHAALQPHPPMPPRTTQCATAVAHYYHTRPTRPLSGGGSRPRSAHGGGAPSAAAPMPRTGGLAKSPRPQSAGGLRVGFQMFSTDEAELQQRGQAEPIRPMSAPTARSSQPRPSQPPPASRPSSAVSSSSSSSSSRHGGVLVGRSHFLPEEAREWRKRIWTPRSLPAARPIWTPALSAVAMQPGAAEHRAAPRLRSDAPSAERVVELQMATTVAASPVQPSQRPASAVLRPTRPTSATARPPRPVSAR